MNKKWVAILVAYSPAAAWLIFSLASKPLVEITLLDLGILVALWLSGGFVLQSFVETRGKPRRD